MNTSIWVVGYVDDRGIPTVTAFDNEIAANLCYLYFQSEGYKCVELDHTPIYEEFLWTWNGWDKKGTPVHVKEKGTAKSIREYTKIYCCGDCINYDWKKHKCKRGASEEGKPTDNFFRDCPNGLFEEEVMNK